MDFRSIQRDIDDIRAYLSNKAVLVGDTRRIVYDRKRNAFVLAEYSSPVMSNSEVLAVSKILLDSRAFSKEEMSSILDKLVAGCVPYKNMKLVAGLLANEKFHYVELTHPSSVQERIWELGGSVSSRRLLEITYQR